MNLSVREKSEAIKRVKSHEFRETVSVAALEEIRKELRGIMKYAVKTPYEPERPRFIDLQDGAVEYRSLPTTLKFQDMPGFRKKVQGLAQGFR